MASRDRYLDELRAVAATGETERLDVRDVYLIARNHPRTTLNVLCFLVLALGTLFIWLVIPNPDVAYFLAGCLVLVALMHAVNILRTR